MKTFAFTLGISCAAASLMLGAAHLSLSAGERPSSAQVAPAALASLTPARAWTDPKSQAVTRVAEAKPAEPQERGAEQAAPLRKPDAPETRTTAAPQRVETAEPKPSVAAARPASAAREAVSPRRVAARAEAPKRAEQSRPQRLAQARARIRVAAGRTPQGLGVATGAAAPAHAGPSAHRVDPIGDFFRGVFDQDG